jgi:hypothetical protein
MELSEVARTLEVVKRQISEALRELEEARGTTAPTDVREKLETVLRELDTVIRPIPPIHIWC